MVKYWSPDGEVLASGCDNSGPEMLTEEFEILLGQMNANGWLCRQNCCFSEVFNFGWTPSLSMYSKVSKSK
jgi:hypothetical protein